MSKLVNPEMCIPHLEDRKRAEKDKELRLGIQIAINILEALPGEKIDELVLCEKCYWYNAERQKCRHKNGLPGKVFPQYYCPFASGEYVEDNQEDEAFEDFEEDDDGI